METKIRYLDQLERDLVRASERERYGEPAGPAPVRRTGRRWKVLVAACVMAALAVAGVTGGVIQLSSNSSSSEAAVTAGSAVQHRAIADQTHPFEGVGKAIDQQVVPEASPTSVPGVSGTKGGGGAPANEGSGAVDLSKVIRTGSMSVTVARDGLPDAVDQVTSIADKEGGFVFSSSIANRFGLMVVHVPARKFDAAITALRQVGTARSVSVSSQDVTSQFIDLHARLKILVGRRRVLQGLYAKATSIEQSLRVLTALNQTQQSIEQIQGELNVIDARTSESTIRVSLREAGVPNVTTQTPVHTPSIGNAWDHAIAGFVGVIAAIVVGLGYLVPLAILALLIWFVIRLARRRRAAS
jgi:hypothetical protein